MRKRSSFFFALFVVGIASMPSVSNSTIHNLIASENTTHSQSTTKPKELKEWTFLTFMSGHNDLDEAGTLDINEMETIGSTGNINVVVQWASLRFKTTKRLYIETDSDPNIVHSSVIEEIPRVDMGDYKQFVEFVLWATKKFPAKHYFINIWNHGYGWASPEEAEAPGFRIRDISSDDLSGHVITTEQLTIALQMISKALGRKVDILGTDACSMAMVEIGGELNPYVEYLIGSEELVPEAGWPYGKILGKWKTSDMSPATISKIVVREALNYYLREPKTEKDEVTFSVLKLDQMPLIEKSLKELGQQFLLMSDQELGQVKAAVSATQTFSYNDYLDIGDFVSQIRKTNLISKAKELIQILADIDFALSQLVPTLGTTAGLRSHGASIWIPDSLATYKKQIERYSHLSFSKKTNWSATASLLYRMETPPK